MGGQKPHLLIRAANNLGAETRVEYASPTKFYLADKLAGQPWITRPPFPVHVVEGVETLDRVSLNRFVTRYSYHHGYFDGIERELRGFGRKEQWDTEEIGSLTLDGTGPADANIDAASHVPPVHTKTWFHTGVYVGRDHISDYFAGIGKGDGEYYRNPALRGNDGHDPAAKALLLEDTPLPADLAAEEEREACRALRGSMLRQEVYALDGTSKEPHPYIVTEQNFTIRVLQPRGINRHAVFFTHPREAVNYHYERNPADPRIQHALTLEADIFGNVLMEAAIAYGRQPGPTDEDSQTRTLITYTENSVTNAVDEADNYRTPLRAETGTYELTGFTPEHGAARFTFDEWTLNSSALPALAAEIHYEETADNTSKQKRLIEYVRTFYRKDDLSELLPLGQAGPLAVPGESYKLAFTPGLLGQVFERNLQSLLPNPADVLGGQGADQGGYLVSQDLKASGVFHHIDPDDHWWIPSGQVLLSPDNADTSQQELAFSRSHFFLSHRYRDPFGAVSVVTYDAHSLLIVETRDPAGNLVTAGERLPDGAVNPLRPANDYRVLQPSLVTATARRLLLMLSAWWWALPSWANPKKSWATRWKASPPTRQKPSRSTM